MPQNKKDAQLSPTEKFEQDALRQQVKQLSKKQLLYDAIGEKILTAISKLPKLPEVKVPKVKQYEDLAEEEMVLVISDVQAGLLVDAKESGGIGSYNLEILLQYIDELINVVIRLKQYHPNVDILNIFFLGDIVEGETIYGGQLREIAAHVIEQVMFCWNEFSRLQLTLASHFKQVRCRGVVGNHGRIGMKGEHSPMSNFDHLLYKMWEERLRSQKNIQWDVSESWWDIADIQGWKFLLVHGDDTGGSFGGIPFYGVQRSKSRYREMFKNSIEENVDFDYMCIGHHSQAAQFQRIIMAGSWCGGTELSIKRMQAADLPSVPIFAVDADWGVTWRRDILLQPIKPTFNRL